jgi:hypothetical protein
VNVKTQRIRRIGAGIPCRNRIVATPGEALWFDYRLNVSGITNFRGEWSAIPVNGGAGKEAMTFNPQDEVFAKDLD